MTFSDLKDQAYKLVTNSTDFHDLVHNVGVAHDEMNSWLKMGLISRGEFNDIQSEVSEAADYRFASFGSTQGGSNV